MAEKFDINKAFETFSDVGKDDVFDQAFIETLFPELLKNPTFSSMRGMFDESDVIWDKTKTPALGGVQDSVQSLLDTIQKTKSRPGSMSLKDKKNIIKGYERVFKEYCAVAQSAAAQNRAETNRVKKEATAVASDISTVIKEADAADAWVHKNNKSLQEYEQAKRQADKKIKDQAKALERRIIRSRVIPGSEPMDERAVPHEPGIDFSFPYQSPRTDRNVKAGYREPESQKVVKKPTKKTFPSVAQIKKFGSQKTTKRILPFQVNAADHARGVEYEFQGPHADALQKAFGGEFKSASKTGTVKRNIRAEKLNERTSSAASRYGTAMHALFEMMDKNGLTVNDIQLRAKELSKDPILSPAFVNGKLKLPAFNALTSRKELLEGGTEDTVFNERGVGGFVKVNGKLQKRTGTVDRLYRDKETGEYIVEDYKNEKNLKPWEHFTQLAAEAALLNANNGLMVDNKGNKILTDNPITRGRIAKYHPGTGTQTFTYYDLGTPEDYQKYLALQEDYMAGKINEKEFFSKLPKEYQKAYSDSFGSVRQRTVGDEKGTGAHWLEIRLPGTEEFSSILFDAKGKPTKTNSLFEQWKKDPKNVEKAINDVFNDPMVPEEYKRDLYWKAYNLSRTIYGEDVDVATQKEFTSMIEGTGKIYNFDIDPNDPKLKFKQAARSRSGVGSDTIDYSKVRNEQFLTDRLQDVENDIKEQGWEYKSFDEWAQKNMDDYSDVTSFLEKSRKQHQKTFAEQRQEKLAPLLEKKNILEQQLAHNKENPETGEDGRLFIKDYKQLTTEISNLEKEEEELSRETFSEWLENNVPGYKEAKAKYDNAVKTYEQKRESANERVDPDLLREKTEIEGQLETINDWFTPGADDRSRKGLGSNELDLPIPDNGEWKKIKGISDALYTASKYHPEYMGEKIKALLALISKREDYLAKGPSGADEYDKQLKRLQLSILGNMSDADDLKLFQRLLGNDPDGVTASQEKFNSLMYDAKANGVDVDSDAIDDVIPEVFSGSATEKAFARYLRFREKLLKGWFPQEFSGKDRETVVQSLDRLLMPQNKDAIDLVGTLTGGMARAYSGRDVYEELEKQGYKLTEEQQREKKFGELIRQAMEEQEASGEKASAAGFFTKFGDDLISKYSIYDEGGKPFLDAASIKNDYGDYAYRWALRYIKMAQNPALYVDEIEQRMAEAFRRSTTTGRRVAYDTFGSPNKDPEIPNQGLTGRDLMQKGIPLSALHYERSKYYANVTPDELPEILDSGIDLEEEGGVDSIDRGEWKLYDDVYREAYKEAVHEHEQKKEAVKEAAEEARPEVKEAAVEAAKKEVEAAIETEVAPVITEAVAEAVDGAAEKVEKTEGKATGGSKGTKKSNSRKSGKKKEIPSSSEEVSHTPVFSGPISGDKIEVTGSPVTVNGSPVNVTGSPVTVNNENGIVQNTGDAPITQNIYTTGGVTIKGGAPGGSGGTLGGSSDGPGSQLGWQYMAARDKENSILNKINDEQIASLGLDKKKDPAQLKERAKRIRALRKELKETRLEIERIRDVAKDAVPEEIDHLDETYERYAKERADKFRLAKAIAGDKKDARDEKEDLANWRTYNSLMKKRSDLLKAMMDDQHKADLSIYNTEKQKIETVNALRAEDIKILDNEMVKMRESGQVSEKDVTELEEKYARINKLNEGAIGVKDKGASNLWENMGNQIHSLFRRFTQMDGVYRILGKIRQGITKVIQSAQQLDKVMTNLRIVTGYSADDAQLLMRNYANLAAQLSSTTAEVSAAAQEWLRQGYQVSEVNDLVSSSIKLSVLGMMSASDATKALTSAMKGFKMEASDVSQIVDKFTSLDMKAATSAGDIATALSKFATTAQMAGLNIDQASAIATTIMDVSQADAGSTGNAIKTILSRYGNVKSGVFTKMSTTDSDDTTEKINDIEKVLSAIGIRMRDSKRELRDFDDVLGDIAEKWANLDKVSQNAIATALAGTRQREAFAVLMNNYDKYQELLEVSENSEGTAAKKYESYIEQLEASQKRLQTAWEDLAQNAQVSKFFTMMNNALTFLVKSLPVILRYVLRLYSITNAYKIPGLISFLMPTKKAGSALSLLTNKGQAQRIADYEKEQGRSPGLLNKVTDKFRLNLNTTTKSVGTFKDAVDAATKKLDELAGKETGTSGKTGSEGATGTTDADKAEKPGATPTEKAPETPRKVSTGQRALRGAAGLASGALTATTSGHDWTTDQDFDVTGEQEAYSRLSTGIVQGALSIFNPIAGMLGGLLMDFVNKYLILPLFNRDKLDRMQRVEQAEKMYTAVSGIRDEVQNLDKTLSKIAITTTELAEQRKAIDEFRDMMYAEENDDVRTELMKYINEVLGLNGPNALTLSEYLDKIENAQTLEERKQLIALLTSIQARVEAISKYTSKEEEIYSKDENSNVNLRNVPGLSRTKDGLDADLREAGDYYRILPYPDTYAPGRGATEEMLLQSIRYISTDRVLEALKEVGIETKHSLAKTGMGWAEAFGLDYDNSTLQGRQEAYGKIYDALGDEIEILEKLSDDEDAQAQLQFLRSWRKETNNALSNVKEAIAAREAAQDTYNRTVISGSVSSARIGDKLLSSYTRGSLAKLGEDAIYGAIAEAVERSGGLLGHDVYERTLYSESEMKARYQSRQIGGETYYQDEYGNLYNSEGYRVDANGNKVLTDYAKEHIQIGAGENSTLSTILSGGAYTLKDLNDLSEEKRKQYITSFANALGITEAAVVEAITGKNEELLQRFGKFTLEEMLKTPTELRESIQSLSSLMSSMASSAGLTAQNIEEIISKMPQLVKYLGDTTELSRAFLENLESYKDLYRKKVIQEIMSDEGVFDDFKNELEESLGTNLWEALQNTDFGNATTLEEIKFLIFTDNPEQYGLTPELQRSLREKFMEYFDFSTDSVVDQQVAQLMSSYLDKTYEKQINNLNEQKAALEQINKQRQHENDLIEARNRLEEAGKEKKRVWREGVGWVYEADQKSIEEAQKKLEEVQNQKKIDDLQLQIDYIQAEKDFLSKLPSEAEYERLSKLYSEWTASNKELTESNVSVLDELRRIYFGDDTTGGKKVSDEIKDATEAVSEDETKAAQALSNIRGGADEIGSFAYLEKMDEFLKDAEVKYGVNSAEYYDAEKAYNQGLKAYKENAELAMTNPTSWEKYLEENENAAAYAQRSESENAPIKRITINGKDYFVTRGILANDSKEYEDIQRTFATGDSSNHYQGSFWDKNGIRYYMGEVPNGETEKEALAFKQEYEGNLGKWMSDHRDVIVKGNNDDNYAYVAQDGKLHSIVPAERGLLSHRGGPILLNENGTEAIITPAGTITSMPSGAGVVPSDITKNLWALGASAPDLLDVMKRTDYDLSVSKQQSDDLNIGVFNMNVTPTENFDVEKWIAQVKSAIAARRGSK